MSGQGLMCVWQAVSVADPSIKGEAPASRVRALTRELAKAEELKYTESAFMAAFPGDTVDFGEYRRYVNSELVTSVTPLHVAEALIESVCWDKCKHAYEKEMGYLKADDCFHLWQMFNRICQPGTCPPVVDVGDLNWWANKIATPMRKRWSDLRATSEPLTFLNALGRLNAAVFSKDSMPDAQRSIDQLHSWLVNEVSMTGWMYKRTRKQGNNWTTWQRRYFVLTPGEVRYFTSARRKERDFKGKVSVNASTRLESLQDYKGLTRKYPNRLRLTNHPIMELELSCVTEHEKKAWSSAIEEVIEACKIGTTPVQAVLAERLAKHVQGQPRQTIDQAVSRLKSVRLSVIPSSLEPQSSDEEPRAEKQSRNSANSSGANADDDSDEEIFDNNAYVFERTKVQAVFDRIDADSNGRLNEREFDEFIRLLLGQSTNEQGMPLYLPIFNDIDEDGDRQITFEEFYSYFTRLVLDQTPNSEAEAALKAEFMKADDIGASAVGFKDLTEFVWDRRRSFRYRGFVKAFDTMTETESTSQFKRFVFGQCGAAGKAYNEDYMTAGDLGMQIRDTQDAAEMNDLAKSLAAMWSAFVKAKGLTSADPETIADRYNLIDVACFSERSNPREPKKLSVDAARWEADPDPTRHSLLILPPGTPLEVPVVDATDEFLQYFGCRLGTENHEQVALLYEQHIENLGYSNQGYIQMESDVVGGAGLERSTRCRFDCPLSNSSGHLILARWQGDEETLEVTAFSVPMNTSVYIPSGTMYSLNYALGSWRGIVQTEATTEYAVLKRQFTEDNDRDLEKVMFNPV